jgi:ADP-heptose:LPS heptosyltransferase
VPVVHSLDGPAAARLFAGEASVEAALGAELQKQDAVVVYSRQALLADAFRTLGLRTLVHDPSPADGHASGWLARPAQELGARDTAAPPPCVPIPAERAAAHPLLEQLPRGFLAVHPGSGSPGKNWPSYRYADLVDGLAGGKPWLLVQGPADDLASGPLREGRGALVADGLPLRTLGALLGQAGLYVGNDSGVSHLAASWGAPVLALFGPTEPAQWSPVGPCVRILRARDGLMASLETARVLEAAREMRRARLRSAADGSPSG